MRRIFTLLLVMLTVGLQAQETMSLNGLWLMGEGRRYTQTVTVPGVHADPTRMNGDTLWYKRTVTMPPIFPRPTTGALVWLPACGTTCCCTCMEGSA